MTEADGGRVERTVEVTAQQLNALISHVEAWGLENDIPPMVAAMCLKMIAERMTKIETEDGVLVTQLDVPKQPEH